MVRPPSVLVYVSIAGIVALSGVFLENLQSSLALSGLSLLYDPVQVTNMQEQLSFIHGNFNDPLPFADDSFDALYQVQVLTYTIDLVKLSKVGELLFLSLVNAKVQRRCIAFSNPGQSFPSWTMFSSLRSTPPTRRTWTSCTR